MKTPVKISVNLGIIMGLFGLGYVYGIVLPVLLVLILASYEIKYKANNN